MQHTPEPWKIVHVQQPDNDYSTQIVDANGVAIATLAWYPVPSDLGSATNKEANAQRIVAAVNACQGIELTHLEIMLKKGKPIAQIIVNLKMDRDDLLLACKAAQKAFKTNSHIAWQDIDALIAEVESRIGP